MRQGIDILIDWISITSHSGNFKYSNYSAYPSLHDWENWETTRGANGYDIGAKHASGCKAYQNSSRPDMGTHVIYSGKTLKRVVESWNANSFAILKYHSQFRHSITRLDVALDFYGTNLTVKNFVDDYNKGNYITALRTASEIKSLTDNGHTFYIGSTKKRKKLVRIYNKGAEQKTDDNWIRVELQIMGKQATELSVLLSETDNHKQTILEAIKSVIEFPMVKEWEEVFKNIRKMQFSKQLPTDGNTEKWLNETVLPTLARVRKSRGNEWFDLYRLAVEDYFRET